MVAIQHPEELDQSESEAAYLKRHDLFLLGDELVAAVTDQIPLILALFT